MNSTIYRISVGIGACDAMAAYLLTWITVSMPPGDYSPLAGQGIEVAPYKMTIGIVAMGVALLALLSNIVAALVSSEASALNRGGHVLCGLVTLGVVAYPFYSPMGFAELYPIVQMEVEAAPSGILIDIRARKHMLPIVMAAGGGLAMTFMPVNAFLMSED